jgi:hypothetical protein
MPVISEATLPDQETYEAVITKMFGSLQPDDPPAGQLFHVAGPGPNGFRVIAVWDSQESFDRFVEERLMPTTRELGFDQIRPPTTSPVSNWFAPQTAAV